MKRLAVLFGCLMFLASPAMATSVFNKYWKDKYLDREKVDEDFYRKGRRAGCYICHVKGEKKEDKRNEYGQAVNKHLDAKDFPLDYVRENPEEAEKKLIEGFKKANELKSKSGEKFGKKLEEGKLPATDAGLDD